MEGFGTLFIVLAIVFGLISLAIVTAVLRGVGKAFNAGNYGWGVCLVVVIVSSIVGGLIGALASSIHPALGILASLFVHTVLVAMLMQAPMIAAFVITLVSQVVLIGLMFGAGLLLALIVGASVGDLIGDGQLPGTSTQTITNSDGSSVQTVVTTDAQGQQTTVTTTTDSQGNTIIRTDVNGTSSTVIESANDAPAAAVAPAAPPKSFRFEYLETLPESLGQKIGREAKITLRDGREHEGTIRRVTPGGVQIEKRVSGGSMLFSIKPADIRAALVREKIED